MENKKTLKNRNWNDMAILGIFAILVIGLTALKPVFLTPDNLINVIRQVSITAIIGIGMTFVLISGEIDLSVGSIAALAGIVVTMGLKDGLPMVIAIVLAMGVGALCGFANGGIHVYARIPSFIVTMGMLNIARGVVLVITNSYPVTGLPDSFKVIGRGYVGFLPVPVIIMFVCYILGYLVLKYVKFGRSIFAIGGNIEAARLSGISVNRNKILIYVLCGVTAAIGGIVLASRMFSGQPSAGDGLELNAIAACVIGGTSTTGGKGRIWGTFLGALIMGIITNGMNLLNISTNWQLIVQGAIIIIAVGLDRIKNTD
ncbi:MAG: ABC transporter permease [Lachnospiraceae bacterium]|jgi:ribose transport system permease protein|nr:ABC transporter permease [Lachnospiraceae bacterium]